MTSNIASGYIQELADRQAEQWEIDAQLTEALKQKFRPEFLNRIDETVIFNTLSREHLAAIVDIQVGELARRLSDRKITLEVTDMAKALLSELGYDPSFGARPLRRLIQQKIDNALAGKILSGEIQDGRHVVIDAAGKTFKFQAAAGQDSSAEST
jgi:ATP-dependent Clp protease ATP-binding subunit ClpB